MSELLQRIKQNYEQLQTADNNEREPLRHATYQLIAEFCDQPLSTIRGNAQGEDCLFGAVDEARNAQFSGDYYHPFNAQFTACFVGFEVRTSNPTPRVYTQEHLMSGKAGFIRVNHFVSMRIIERFVEQNS